jgi:hypothetical protein
MATDAGVTQDAHMIDIVAVHGIVGDAYTTWSHGDKLWLRDFLPKEFPGARIYSFGYNATVLFSKGLGTVDSFARELLESVKHA